MHELGIASEICKVISREAKGRRVLSVKVEVGALAGVAVDALRFCIGEMARQEGLLTGEIEIVEVPAAAKCRCGNAYEANDLLDGCPSCGGYHREMTGGMDIMVREILLEDETK